VKKLFGKKAKEKKKEEKNVEESSTPFRYKSAG
jgi:hypothetical protein